MRPLPGVGGDDGSVVVYADANPRWIGYEDLGPWNRIWHSLSSFIDVRGMAEHPGCMHLSGRQLVGTIHPLTDLKCPTLCILTELYRRGWAPVRRTVQHDSAVITVMDGREAVKMKAYYIVLLNVANCLDLSSIIPSNQPVMYYRLLLEGRAVEPGLGAAEYSRLMFGGDVEPPAAIEDDPEASVKHKNHDPDIQLHASHRYLVVVDKLGRLDQSDRPTDRTG